MKRKAEDSSASGAVSVSSSSSKSRTGCSNAFANLVLSSAVEKIEKKEEGQVESSKAMGLLVERPALHGLILPHLVQKSIFAYGPDVSDADRKHILNKINKIAREYIANRYTTVIREFELPFNVKATWGITPGYKASARPVKVEEAKDFAAPSKKKKTRKD